MADKEDDGVPKGLQGIVSAVRYVPPKVMIECPHLVTFQIGRSVCCSMCGANWEALPETPRQPVPTRWRRFKVWLCTIGD